jgi:hypothetical protein
LIFSSLDLVLLKILLERTHLILFFVADDFRQLQRLHGYLDAPSFQRWHNINSAIEIDRTLSG